MPLLSYDFEQSVGYWLLTTASVYEQAINAELEPHNITFRQAQVLGFSALHANLGQTELAELMRVEPPTLTGILDRMERDGWIRRVPDSRDRRCKRIEPLPAAQPIWSQIADCARRVRVQAVEGLTPSEKEQLLHLLSKVRQNLSPEISLEFSRSCPEKILS